MKSFDGAELHVEESGDPDAPLTVLLAHGWTLGRSAWRAQADALEALALDAQAADIPVAGALAVEGRAADDARTPTTPGGIRVLRYDQRGHGDSTRGADWLAGITGPYGRGPSIDQLGRDMAAILDALVPSGPVVLGGHSMGGMTIMALADQCPELFGGRVVGVLLTNTSAGGMHRLTLGFPQWTAAPVRKGIISAMRRMAARPEQADRIRARQRPDSKAVLAQTRWLLFGKRASREAVLETAELVHACPSATLGGFFPALLSHDKHHALPALGATRVEIAVGSRDKLTPVSHARRLAAGIPGARLTVVQGTGHMLPTERPDAVTALLVALVRSAHQEDQAAR